MESSLKSKLLNCLLILTSLLGYLEWGGDNQAFLFQLEGEVLDKLVTEPADALHPFTVLPLLGQLLLLFTLFQKRPNKTLTYIGIGCIGLLLMMILVIGILNLNFKMLLSTIPFIGLSIYTIKNFRSKKLPVDK